MTNLTTKQKKAKERVKKMWVWTVIARYTNNPTIWEVIGVYESKDLAHKKRNELENSKNYELSTVYRNIIRTSL